MNKAIATFEGKSPFTFYIEKAEAEPVQEDGRWIVYGCASSSNVDHDQERMAPQALEQMANIINKDAIPLRYEHQKDEASVIGKVFEAHVDERNKMMIKCELDKENPIAKALWDGIVSGSKMGFSVGGQVLSAARELVEGIGKKIRTFYNVHVDEVSMTPRPSNFDSWMVNHSFAKSQAEAATYRDDFRFYSKFLIDNPGLDYLAVIEKSIPDKEWIKVDSNIQNINTMKIIKASGTTATETGEVKETVTPKETTEQATKAESTIDEITTSDKEIPVTETKETTDTTTKETSDEDTVTSKSYVDEVVGNLKKELDTKFGDVLGVLKAIKKSIDTTDTTTTTKDRTGQEDTSGLGGETATVTATPAVDSEQPVETKTDTEVGKGVDEITSSAPLEATNPDEPKTTTGEETAAGDVSENIDNTDTTATVSGEKTKSSETTPSKESSTTTTETTKNDYGSEYVIPDVEEAMKSARAQGINPLDAFVYALTKHIRAFEDRMMEQNSTRLVGFTNKVAEAIRTDKSIQKSIKNWMGEPNAPKSVAFGVPYLRERNGDAFRLIPANQENPEIKKSMAGKTFKEVYQEQLSSTANGENR